MHSSLLALPMYCQRVVQSKEQHLPGRSQVHLEGQWWAADVGFGSQVPRQPVPLQAAESDAAPGRSGSWRPPDAAVYPPDV